MPTIKPTKPSITLPSAFGTSVSNVKTAFTAQELIDGYSSSIPQVLDGGNVNWLNDALFKYLTYTTAICDWLNGIGASKVPFINSSNQLDAATPVLDNANNTFTGTNTFTQTVVADISGNAETATKATKDGSGNTITTTYMDKNASNATATGKKTASTWSFPDTTRSVNPTLPASGQTYTAPENGYLIFDKRAGAVGQYVKLSCGQMSTGSVTGYTTDVECPAMLPVKKGDVVTVTYTATGTTEIFRFVYAKDSAT